MTKARTWDDRTVAARAGINQDQTHGAISPVLIASTTFAFPSFGTPGTYDYTRSGNPTRATLGHVLAELEGGHDAVVTASGMAAINLTLSMLRPDDLVVAPHDCYGSTHRLLRERAKLGHFRVQFADLTEPDSIRTALNAEPKIVLIETPSNPLLRITDIKTVAMAAKAVGALVVADNTFLSPVLQKPLQLGADIVVHSLTKYLNGHSDVVGGAVVVKSPEMFDKFAWWANTVSVTGAPFDSSQVLRGLRTVEIRVKTQTKTAGNLAAFLSNHPAVAHVYYPGLKQHPGHELAVTQQRGFGAMLSFELQNPAATETFVNALTKPGSPVSLAESLGGFETLLAHPATMTHAAMTPEARRIAGISEGLLRLSVGLETARDLRRALTDAFAAIGVTLKRLPTGKAGRTLVV